MLRVLGAEASHGGGTVAHCGAPLPPVTSSGDALGRGGWPGHLVPPADSLATGPLSPTRNCREQAPSLDLSHILP